MKLYLAPIKGITDSIYRNVFAKHFTGVDLAIAPFVSSVQSRKLKTSYLRDLFPENNKHMPVIPQILSKDGDDFVFMVNNLQDLGYDTINWNLGCPVSMVAKKKRGSGLLPHPDIIRQFLDIVCSKINCSLSVKLRLGRYSPDEIGVLLPIFNDYPLQEVIIHPRLGVQLYKGKVDLDSLDKYLPLCKHHVVYNGDINSDADYQIAKKRFEQIDSWMVGRGLLKNPFLAQNIKNPVSALKTVERKAILLSFHQELFDKYQEKLSGDSHLLGRMKGIWVYLSAVFVDSRRVNKKINKTQQVSHYLDAIHDFFEHEPLDDALVKSRDSL